MQDLVLSCVTMTKSKSTGPESFKQNVAGEESSEVPSAPTSSGTQRAMPTRLLNEKQQSNLGDHYRLSLPYDYLNYVLEKEFQDRKEIAHFRSLWSKPITRPIFRQELDQIRPGLADSMIWEWNFGAKSVVTSCYIELPHKMVEKFARKRDKNVEDYLGHVDQANIINECMISFSIITKQSVRLHAGGSSTKAYTEKAAILTYESYGDLRGKVTVFCEPSMAQKCLKIFFRAVKGIRQEMEWQKGISLNSFKPLQFGESKIQLIAQREGWRKHAIAGQSADGKYMKQEFRAHCNEGTYEQLDTSTPHVGTQNLQKNDMVCYAFETYHQNGYKENVAINFYFKTNSPYIAFETRPSLTAYTYATRLLW